MSVHENTHARMGVCRYFTRGARQASLLCAGGGSVLDKLLKSEHRESGESEANWKIAALWSVLSKPIRFDLFL